jgi:hypothetical protein
MFLYAQTFTLPDGSTRTREGVLLSLALEEFSRGVVLPHEKTLPGPKADRLAIIRATGANLSPIFGLYARRASGPATSRRGGPPLVEATTRRAAIACGACTDAAAIARFAASLADERIIIADGHHRYETALAYRDEQRTRRRLDPRLCDEPRRGGGGRPADAPDACARPLRMDTATLASRLADMLHDRAARRRAAARRGRDRLHPARSPAPPPGHVRSRPRASPEPAAGDPHARRERAPRRDPRPRSSASTAETLEFTHDDEEALDAVTTGHAAARFLLNPPSLAAVRAVCLAGELMPEKSTYFYPEAGHGPRLPTGGAAVGVRRGPLV